MARIEVIGTLGKDPELKFIQGKNAKNMWLEDARRLGRPF